MNIRKLQQFDAANLRLAEEVIADPARYPHLVLWARRVLLRLGDHFERSLADAREGLALMKGRKGI
jgi:hypothetical protein